MGVSPTPAQPARAGKPFPSRDEVFSVATLMEPSSLVFPSLCNLSTSLGPQEIKAELHTTGSREQLDTWERVS